MPSPTPTPTPGVPELLIGFFWNHWLGQLLLGAAILGIIGWIFRTWIKHRLQQVAAWARDLRVTRRSTVAAEISSAVAGAEAEWQARVDSVRAEGADALQRLRDELTPSSPAVVTPEQAAEIREHYQHERSTEDQWILSTFRSRRQGYVLTNYAAREARNVRLASPFSGAFEFLDTTRWDQIDQGDSVHFSGRIADPSSFSLHDRELQVRWTDDHGDEQSKYVQVDRDDKRPWL